MYLKDPFKKVSYTFRIEEQLLENIKSYANAENRKLPETFNLLLKKSLKDITVSDTYLDNQVGAVIKIPYDLPIAKDNVIDTDGIDTGIALQIQQIPNNLDIWDTRIGYHAKNHQDTLHEGIEIVVLPQLITKEKYYNYWDTCRDMDTKIVYAQQLLKAMVILKFTIDTNNDLSIYIISLFNALDIAKDRLKYDLYDWLFNLESTMENMANAFDIDNFKNQDEQYYSFIRDLEKLASITNTGNIIKDNSIDLDKVTVIDNPILDKDLLIMGMQDEITALKKENEENKAKITEYDNQIADLKRQVTRISKKID